MTSLRLRAGFDGRQKRIARECRAQIARRLANIRVPLVLVVHLSSRKEGREDTGIPCISASVLRDVVDPSGGDDLPSLACAAICNNLPETGEIARGCADATGAPRRAQSASQCNG